MKLISIFADHIWSVLYDNQEKDAFSEMFSHWRNFDYLDEYFERNKELLEKSFWKNYGNVKELKYEAYSEVLLTSSFFHTLYENTLKKKELDFDQFFKRSLSENSYEWTLETKKAYGRKYIRLQPSMLRIYAIKIEPNVYVITGGGIKLTQTMQEMPELQLELNHINAVKSYLKDNAIEMEEDLKTLEDEQ